MKRVLLFVNSQNLYGPRVLEEAEAQGREIVLALNKSGCVPNGVEVVFGQVVTTAAVSLAGYSAAAADETVIGCLAWCKTFSPAQMHTEAIAAWKRSGKPFGLLHTQYRPVIPLGTLDQDFMNANQDAHGGREYSHGLRQLDLPFTPFTGDWSDQPFQRKLGAWIEQALAGTVVVPAIPVIGRYTAVRREENPNMQYAAVKGRDIICCRFGGKMRQVLVTDGWAGGARIDHGWQILDFGVGDLVDAVAQVQREPLNLVLQDWSRDFDLSRIAADPLKWDGVIYQAKLYLAIKDLLKQTGGTCFTTSFEQTHGLQALPGLAAQVLMAEGIGFGPEGHWEIACLGRLVHLALAEKGLSGSWWSLMEDYVYDFLQRFILGSHMLEISTAAAADKPVLDVFELTIGRSGFPARAIFDAKPGPALNIALLYTRSGWELVTLPVEIIPGRATPRLPTAKSCYQPVGSAFEESIDRCLLAGVAHHTIQVAGLTMEDAAALAGWMPNTKFVPLGEAK